MYNFRKIVKAFLIDFNKTTFFVFENNTNFVVAFSLETLEPLWKLELKNSYYELKIINNLIYLDGGRNTTILDLFGNIISDENLLGFNISLRRGFKDYCIISKIGFESEFPYGLYSLNSRNKLFWFTIKNIFTINIINKLIIASNSPKQEKDLFRISDEGDKLWHFNLETLYESHPAQMAEYLADPVNSQYYKPIIGNIVGVHNGLLWLDIDMTYHSNFLLALDAETGVVVHFLQHIYPQKDFDGVCIDGRPNRMPMYSQTHLDEKRNILFGFGADIFHWQVDLNDQNPKIKMWDLRIEAEKANGHFSALANCGVSDSHVFFPVGGMGTGGPGVIGLNRDTLEVDYRLYMEPTKDYYTPTKIKVSDTHLFVLDNNSTLSVYEKTEN